MAVPKYGGRDCELSTTGQDANGKMIDPWAVTQNVLRHIGDAVRQFGGVVWTHPTAHFNIGKRNGNQLAVSADCLRNWTDGGQCYYSDMAHVEVCTATCLRPTDFAAQCLSTLLVADSARRHAELAAGNGDTLQLTTSNADMLDPAISFGTHLSMQVSKNLWEELNVDQRRPATLAFVASALAAAVPFFGAGYLLPLRDGSVIYSLSARAHHIQKLRTISTTQAFGRGLLNGRREAHTTEHERLHLIAFDYDVLSSALLFSFLQCVLAAAEEGYCGPILRAPLDAMHAWSWQFDGQFSSLPETARTIDGRRWTLPAFLRHVCEDLLDMVECGFISESVAPQAQIMLTRLVRLADYAARGRIFDCASQLGWAAKLAWLIQLLESGTASFADPAARVADHDFVSTDPRRGAFWKLWDAGLVDPLCTLDDARVSVREAPAESRDWGRGKIIRRFLGMIEAVNWNYVLLRTQTRRRPYVRIDLPHLDSLNKASLEPVLADVADPIALRHRLRDVSPAALRMNNQNTKPSDRVTIVPASPTSN